MEKFSHFLLLLCFFPLFTKDQRMILSLELIHPPTATQAELAAHKKIGSAAYFKRDLPTLPNVIKHEYDEWFETAYEAFRRQKEAFLLSISDEQKNKVGGLYIKTIGGPHPSLNLKEGEFVYTYAINTRAQHLYEKGGYVLLTDVTHPDGKWSDAAKILMADDEYS
jgi:hypothetical protein